MNKLQEQQLVATQEGLLHRIANRIRQSLELKEILNTMVAEVRDYLETDRVKVYQFNPDSSGVVIAESIHNNRLPSLLGLHFPADDIPPYARELFLRARQRSVVDVASAQIGISPLEHPETGEIQEDNNIRYRLLDPCHAEYLTAMGVKSSVIVPIVLEEVSTGKEKASTKSSAQLWGLLACHHSESRNVTEEELQFIQAVVDQVGVAIAQSILLNQVRSQAKQEANINRVTELLYTSPTVKSQAALEEAVATFSGSGGRLYLLADEDQPREIYTYGKQPDFINEEKNRVVEENYLWKSFLHSAIESSSDSTGYKPWSVQWMRSVYNLGDCKDEVNNHPNLWAIDDLYREPLFRTLAPFFQSTSVRSLLIIPLHYGNHIVGCLTIFRDEVDTEILWSGWHNPDTRQLMARQSFEVWRQEKKGQAQPWTEEELKYAQALSERFSTAIKQYRLYQQVQALNANLEHQVEERTEQLQQKTQQLQVSNIELENFISRQQALAGIVAKIRESLEIEEIFRITTKELSQILDVDRVSVYQFNSDWGGEFVADFECITPKWVDVGNLGVNTVWDDTYLQETQGGRYAKGQFSVVNDVYQQKFSQCHLDIYEQFEIKAFIVVPIFVGKDLWGLLGVYQHQDSRDWKPSEVEFTFQIAAQLGVALQHSSLLAYTRQQAKELKKSNGELQRGIETQKAISSIVAKIRSSLDVNVVFSTTTQAVRELLEADRVVIYRFNPDWSGEFIAESVNQKYDSLMQIQWEDNNIQENVNQCSIQSLSVLSSPDTYLVETQGGSFAKGEVFRVCNDIYNADFHDCYIKVLEFYQTRAYVIIAIYQKEKLWGLLAAYQNDAPREWQDFEVQFLQQISEQMSVALQQSDLHNQVKYQAEELKQTLTNLKETQTQLIQTEKMSSLGQLVAGIAHEINNPVNFIHANLAHLEEYTGNILKALSCYQEYYPEPGDEVQALLEEADIEYITEDLPKLCSSLSIGTKRIQSIVLSLRSFSRLDEAEMKPVDIHDGIEGTLLILQHRLKTDNSKVIIDIVKEYSELPLVQCYAGQLNQVFMNLLANAIDELQSINPVSEKDNIKNITIKTQLVENDWIKVSIKDDGDGITPEVLDKLFDPFFTTKEVGKGTGLGLSISYKIIEKHGGKLYCNSTVGEGAEFVIELPCKSALYT
ncbi:GAF sensor signal transduction histidine kinase [Calothrix parasitica NIES-267]|uniref:histidine kinase n=1 Tax=Calothrix parasitica NIES-267 TaxID=1973488 RepID=A0A1Z4LZJ6_9CYAN|nr:GAF sensor signal transduction histidine kinase [Calothrix parasitica NIES-267]